MDDLVTIDTPFGPAHAWVRDGVLRAFRLATAAPRSGARRPPVDVRPVPESGGVAAALAAYFRGDVTALDAVRVAPEGTPFQQRVWAALRTIPPGDTATYGEIARAMGAPTAARAVGAANHRNPIWIVVPCHRVIGASGALTGYAGGLDVKRRLLEHERQAVDRLLASRASGASVSRNIVHSSSATAPRLL